ncbi:membrane protein [Streptomyces sp. MMG1121]|nr:membrane protein [Streptomyces sp. MMG1121]
MSASVSLAVTHLVPLAKEIDENKVTPGVLGFIVFAVMALAVWGLMKSMSKHMGKVDFKEAPQTGAEQPDKADSAAQRG